MQANNFSPDFEGRSSEPKRVGSDEQGFVWLTGFLSELQQLTAQNPVTTTVSALFGKTANLKRILNQHKTEWVGPPLVTPSTNATGRQSSASAATASTTIRNAKIHSQTSRTANVTPGWQKNETKKKTFYCIHSDPGLVVTELV